MNVRPCLWARLGVTKSLSPTLHAVVIPGGAHHLDFFWSHKDDLPTVIAARVVERGLIGDWIAEKRANHAAVAGHAVV